MLTNLTYLDSRTVIRPMVIGQLKANMEKFEELKVCADIINEMLSSFDRIPDMVSSLSLKTLGNHV